MNDSNNLCIIFILVRRIMVRISQLLFGNFYLKPSRSTKLLSCMINTQILFSIQFWKLIFLQLDHKLRKSCIYYLERDSLLLFQEFCFI
jgi:hypothetical protein